MLAMPLAIYSDFGLVAILLAIYGHNLYVYIYRWGCEHRRREHEAEPSRGAKKFGGHPPQLEPMSATAPQQARRLSTKLP